MFYRPGETFAYACAAIRQLRPAPAGVSGTLTGHTGPR